MTNCKFKHTLLAALLLCVTGLATTACSDSNDAKGDERIMTEDGKVYVPDSLLTDQERYQLACQTAVMGTMRSLAGLETVGPDVVNQKYEPVYGQTLDDEDASVRVVKCNNTEEAEKLFRAIAGLDSIDAPMLISPTPDGCALSLVDLPILPDGKRFNLGTLIFHRDGGPRRCGYVEVSIPCMPHLERIDYLSPEAFPDNASCPYQLGDIVYVPSGRNLCSGYYVCIANNGYRSTLAHMKHGKNPGGDESINADGDSEGCWRPYNNDHGHKTSYEDIKDYVSFMLENKAKVANIKAFLNGEAYNKKPLESGKLDHIFPEGFNNDRGVAYSGSTAFVYYDGYITDDYAWVPAYNYRNALYATIPNGCDSRSKVGCGNKKYVEDSEWNKWVGSHEFTMNVIHTDGRVSDSRLEYSALNDPLEMGIRAEYATTEHLGWFYADDGLLYESYAKAVKYGHNPLGVLAYVNDHSQFGDIATEAENGYGHGLVISFNNATDWNARFNPENNPIVNLDDGYGFTQFVTDMATALTDGNGSAKTAYLADHESPAALQAQNYTRCESAGTGWMIPSTTQWIAMLCGPNSLGKARMPSGTGGLPISILYDGEHPFTRITNICRKAAYFHYLRTNFEYWTSSVCDAKRGVYIQGDDKGVNLYMKATTWSQKCFIRPAFAY